MKDLGYRSLNVQEVCEDENSPILEITSAQQPENNPAWTQEEEKEC